MATQVSLLFFLYMVGMSWSLIGIILFEIEMNPRLLVEGLLLWPILWIFIVALSFSFAVGRCIECITDTGSNIHRVIKNRD